MSTTVAVVELVLGLVFFAMARKHWEGRPKAGQEAELPKWMATVDRFTPGKSLGLGAVLFYTFAADKAAGPLATMKGFMSDHNAVIMMIVLGAKLLGNGIGGLTD